MSKKRLSHNEKMAKRKKRRKQRRIRKNSICKNKGVNNVQSKQ